MPHLRRFYRRYDPVRHRFTQQQLADFFGVHRSTIHRWQRDAELGRTLEDLKVFLCAHPEYCPCRDQ